VLLFPHPKKFWLSLWVLLLCTVLINSIVLYQINKKNQRDRFTGCLNKIEQKHIFILDPSSIQSTQTRSEIFSRITHHLHKIKKEDLALVYLMDGQSINQLQPVFKACNTHTNFEKLFLKSVKNAMYAQSTAAVTMPLAEALLDIELSQHQIQPKRTHFFIFSNFLQNSQDLSFIQAPDVKTAIEQFKSSRLGGVQRPTFINTTVYLHIIPQAQLTENLLNIRDGFWIWFFGDMRGSKQSYGLERHDLPGS
jgi:hypothetical protein